MDGAGEHRRKQAAPADRREREADEREKHPDEQEAGTRSVRREQLTVAPRDEDAAGGRSKEVQIPAALRTNLTLMETTASIERDIALTLDDMAAQAEGETAARRRRLAQDAVRGAQEADKRAEHLRQLAREWIEHAEVEALHQLLAHAAQLLGDLARTEQDIADAFTVLASQDGSALAAQRRQLAVAATADAQKARDHARDLHELARTSASRVQHQQSTQAGSGVREENGQD